MTTLDDLFDLKSSEVLQDSIAPDKSDLISYFQNIERYIHGILQTYAPPMINGHLDVSIGSNVLTVAVKTALDADPTTDDPVHFVFRDNDDGGDEIDRVAVTAALNLTVDAGADLGASDAVAFRVWIVAFNDGGTVRFGAVVLYDETTGNFFSLDEGIKRTSTALSAAADTAGTIYSDTAVSTARAFRIVAYLTFDSGLTTAGLWDVAPDVVHHVGPMTPRPGSLIQKQRASSSSAATGSTAIPADDTLPSITEGDQYLTDSITPSSPANIIKVESDVQASLDGGGTISAALNDGSAVVAARGHDISGSDDVVQLKLKHEQVANQAGALTFNVRLGPSGGTLRFNGNSAQLFSIAGISDLELTEIFA